MFPSPPFLASISLEIEEKKANPSFKMVDRLVHGKITPDKVIMYAKKLQSKECSDEID